MSGRDNIYVTQEDFLNNPGVSPSEIAEVKSQYHFHKLSSATFTHHTLICTFQIDLDPSSIFYTLPENGSAPVREYEVDSIGDVEILLDGLAVKITTPNKEEIIISSEEIWNSQ